MDAKPYYSFNWGGAHFVVLDTDINSAAPTQAERDAYWAAETRWLEDELAASQEPKFRFIFGHHPPMTAVKRRQGDNPHMTALEPLFEKYHVTAAFRPRSQLPALSRRWNPLLHHRRRRCATLQRRLARRSAEVES